MGPYAFDPSDSSAPLRTYHTRGNDCIDGTFHYTSHQNIFGATVDDGKAEAFRKVQAGLNVQSLQDKAAAWQAVHTHINKVQGQLSNVYKKVFAAWQGDDADAAQKTFGHVSTSLSALSDNAQAMYSGTDRIAKAAAAAKGQSADGPGFGDRLSGGLGLGGGDGDGNADVQAYFNLVDAVSGGRDDMPGTVQWQVKTDPGSRDSQGGDPGAGGGPHAGAGGVHGVSAPHVSGGTTPHSAVATPSIKDPNSLHHPNGTGVPPVTTDSPGGVGTTPLPGTVGAGHGGYGSGSSGLPHLDTGSTLAGLDGSGGGLGAGGLGAGGAGVGSLGGGGLAGGAGGLAGTGGLAGAGMSGAGAGLAGAGSGAAGVAGGRPGGAGMMMPMRGGGKGNDEDERERSTWLSEDDDVWGDTDAPPSVIR